MHITQINSPTFTSGSVCLQNITQEEFNTRRYGNIEQLAKEQDIDITIRKIADERHIQGKNMYSVISTKYWMNHHYLHGTSAILTPSSISKKNKTDKIYIAVIKSVEDLRKNIALTSGKVYKPLEITENLQTSGSTKLFPRLTQFVRKIFRG